MTEIEDQEKTEHHNEGHDRWLALQSAYLEYRQASEALDCTRQSSEEFGSGEHVRILLLEGTQRVTFERYLEARISFLEFHVDEMQNRERGPGGDIVGLARPDWEDSGHPLWRWFGNWRTVLEVLAVLLLCMTSFSLLREQTHVSALEADHEELRAALKQAHDGLQLLGKKLDTPVPAEQPAVQPVSHTPPKHDAASRNPATPERAESHSTRKSYSFFLSPFHQSARVGPVDVSLRSLNMRQNTVSLSIKSGHRKIDLANLKPNQKVPINIGQPQSLDLVVGKISGNRLDAQLVEHPKNKVEVASRVKLETRLSP